MAAGIHGCASQDDARVPQGLVAPDLTCEETFHVPPTPEDEKASSSTIKQKKGNEADFSCNIPPVKAFRDLALVHDDRILQNLLRMESRSLPSAPDYFRFVQKDLKPSMRKIVADWMLQVCQELQCQPEVFALAMNYLDRFLARCRVRKGSLQLLGSVCLLVASKFKETCPILGERLIFYSDFSVKSEELKVGEK